MKFLEIASTAIALCAGTGCALHHPLLGTRVHRFSLGGVNLVHCSILIDTSQTQMAHDAIEVCRDEIQAPPPVSPHKGGSQ